MQGGRPSPRDRRRNLSSRLTPRNPTPCRKELSKSDGHEDENHLPICHHETCSCMLGDRRFLARQVGKLLRGGQDSDLATGEGRKGQPKDNGGTADDCFATPPWLVEVLRQDYGDFGLDAAASHGHAVAERDYTAADDALRQDWAKDCDGKPVFMNPPFNDLERFVKKAYEESRREPRSFAYCLYKSHPWFRGYVWQHAEVRMVQGQVVFQGFGPQEGECAGNRGRMQFDTVVAVFRPGRQASLGPYIDRLGNGRRKKSPRLTVGSGATTVRGSCRTTRIRGVPGLAAARIPTGRNSTRARRTTSSKWSAHAVGHLPI